MTSPELAIKPMGRYKPYPAYRNSGVEWLGEVPEGWEVLRSRRAFKQVRDPANLEDQQLAATQTYGVIPQRLFMEYQEQKVVLALAGTGNFKHVEIDDFVISLRSFQGGIERCHYEGCVSPAYTVLRKQKGLAPKYFGFLLKSNAFITVLQSVTQGIREGKTVSYEQFGGVFVPLPNMSEQQLIAAFLDRETGKIDQLIEKKQRLIDLLKEKRTALISHAVTKGLDPSAPMKDSGVEWLGEVPEGWRVKKLRYLIKEPLTNGLFKKKESFGSGVKLVNVFDAYRKDFLVDIGSLECVEADRNEEKKYAVHGGDIFFVRSSLKLEGVGRSVCALTADEPMVFECHLVKAQPNQAEIKPKFMVNFLNSAYAVDRIISVANKVTMATIGQESIKSLELPVPPRPEQDEIMVFLDRETGKVDRLIDKVNAAIDTLREYRTALISAAVTGKIDVRDEVAA